MLRAACQTSQSSCFMKSLDPRSVVREGEFQVAANAGGLWDRLTVLQKVEDGVSCLTTLGQTFRRRLPLSWKATPEATAASHLYINRTSFLTGVSEADVERTLNEPFSSLQISLRLRLPASAPPGMDDDNELKRR